MAKSTELIRWTSTKYEYQEQRSNQSHIDDRMRERDFHSHHGRSDYKKKAVEVTRSDFELDGGTVSTQTTMDLGSTDVLTS